MEKEKTRGSERARESPRRHPYLHEARPFIRANTPALHGAERALQYRAGRSGGISSSPSIRIQSVERCLMHFQSPRCCFTPFALSLSLSPPLCACSILPASVLSPRPVSRPSDFPFGKQFLPPGGFLEFNAALCRFDASGVWKKCLFGLWYYLRIILRVFRWVRGMGKYSGKWGVESMLF